MPAVVTAGALVLLDVSSGCSNVETVPGGSVSAGSGGSGGTNGAKACVAIPTASGVPVVPWSHGYEMYVKSIAADPGAAMIVGATVFEPLLDLGLGQLDVPEDGGDLVAKISPEGQLLWNRVWDSVSAPLVAADACGDIIVARVPTLDPSPGIVADKHFLMLAKLDGEGHDIWQRSFHPEPGFQVSRVLIDAHGDAVVLGSYQGLLDLGKDVPSSPSKLTPFVACFAGTTGETLWNVDFDVDGLSGIGLSPDDEVLLAGNLTRVGKASVTASPSPSDGSLVVARLTPSGELKSYSHTGPSTPRQERGYVVSPQGDVGAVGLCPVGNSDPQWCMVRFPADGAAAVQQTIGTETLWKEGGQVAFDAEGNLLMLSRSFDTGDQMPPYKEHLYLTKMGPTGAILRAEDWRSGGEVAPEAIHVDPAGGILIAARLGPNDPPDIDLGNGPVSADVLTRFAP